MIIGDLPDNKGNVKKEILFTKNSATRSDDDDDEDDDK